MPRLDAYHETVKRALVNDGWTITHDPLTIKYKRLRWYADLGAEKAFAAEVERIVWEDFFQRSAIKDIVKDQQINFLL